MKTVTICRKSGRGVPRDQAPVYEWSVSEPDTGRVLFMGYGVWSEPRRAYEDFSDVMRAVGVDTEGWEIIGVNMEVK